MYKIVHTVLGKVNPFVAITDCLPFLILPMTVFASSIRVNDFNALLIANHVTEHLMTSGFVSH